MRVSFEWDEGNNVKSYTKHGISRQEAESVFQDDWKLHFADPIHSGNERRYITVGRSAHPRILFVAWTLRGAKVRVISARPAGRKERHVYEEKNKGRKRS